MGPSKVYRDARRRVKDMFKPPSSSSSANLPSHAPSTQPLPIAARSSPPPNPPHAPLPKTSGIFQRDADTSIQHLPIADIASPSRTNLPPSSNASPPTTSIFQAAKVFGSVTWAGLGKALGVLKESLVVFPPLKSAVSGLLECRDILQVNYLNLVIYWCR
jgi:hypothetical protein